MDAEIKNYLDEIISDRKLFGKDELGLCSIHQRGGYDHDGNFYDRDMLFIIFNGLHDNGFKIQYYCEYGEVRSETVLSPDQYRQVIEDKGLLKCELSV